MQPPHEQTIRVNDLDMCYFEWVGDPEHTVLLLHATGFHARCWDATVEALRTSCRVIALDLRGHGRTANRPPYDWNTISDDVVDFVDTLNLTMLTVAGHSMGGRCALYLAAHRPERVQSLVLVDPVVMSPDQYRQRRAEQPAMNVDDHPVARRRNRFDSPQSMIDRFESRHPFNRWQSRALRDYCVFGLIPTEVGFELACPPAVEAQIYSHSAAVDVTGLLSVIRQPTVVMRAKERPANTATMDFSASPTWPDLAQTLPHGTDRYLPELSHFIPMEQPALVAQEIENALGNR